MELQHISDNNWLSTSWIRSEQAGLKQRRRPEDIRVTPATLQDRRHQLNFLLETVTQFALPLFNQLFAHSDSRLILTDADGVIIGSWGQGIIIANEDGQILAHNQVASQLLAQQNVIGQSLDDILSIQSTDHPFVFKTKPLTDKKVKSRSVTASNDLHYGDSTVEHCWQQANRVIDKDISLLILGETGVGKNEFVKALHKNSQRKTGPLVSVNCGALPKDLVESELFGYVAGAFTGANNKGYQGKIRQAHKGILFLDEIADLPLDAQSRLLHVLQDKTVLPVGSNQSVQVDTQIIAATHKDLDSLVSDGLFRQDLYYRLNGLIIELPRFEQRDDKQQLIENIHRRHAESEQQLCPHLLSLLLSYSWPGNLRELDSLIKVSALMAQGEETLALAHVPTHLSKKLSQAQDVTTAAEPTLKLRATVEDKLLKTYQANQGNISKTSRMLGVSRNTIYRKLKSLGILG